MSIRQSNPGGIVKPSFNPLSAQTSVTYYDIYTWGYGVEGQLGDNTAINKSSPVQVGVLATWAPTTTITGFRHNLAIKTDGTMWSWGKNTQGHLGDGTTANKSSPIQIGADTTWYKIATGAGTSFSIKTNGTLWSWGAGGSGGHGQNDTIDKTSPVQLGALTTWSKIAAGNFHGMAIKTDGTLWMWGNNSYGQLGHNIGVSIYRSSPVQVGALTTWLDIAGGGYSTYAIKTDGTLWAWGRGQIGGMLGLNSTTDRSSPVQVGGDTNWYSVNGGSEFVVALKTTGTLWGWGRNDFFGQLGDGTKTSRSSPVQIGSLTTWSKAEAGRTHSLALKTDGTLWTWGYNDVGELGLNDRVDRSSPVQIGSFTDWLSLSAGGYHNLAVR